MSKQAIDGLEKEILSEAEARAESALERAERIVQRIERNAARKADDIRREAQRRLAPQIENEKARAMALVELEVKRHEASLREQLVEEAFADARAELQKWRSRPDKAAILIRLIETGLGALPGSRFVVELDASDLEALGSKTGELSAEVTSKLGAQAELSLKASDEPILGGARVKTEDGRSQVDQTFEARLARAMPEMRRELHREIFASAAGSEEHSS